MQMIDLMKRLAELDAHNPNVVKEANKPFGMAKYSSLDPSRPGADEPNEPMYPADKPAARKPSSGGKSKFVIINDPKEFDDARFFGLQQSKKNPKVWAWSGNMDPHHTQPWGDQPGNRVDPEEKFASGAWKKWQPKAESVEEEQGVAEGLEECGMMGMGASAPMPHTPASINMTAASGEELSAMLKDIMTLAGRPEHSEPMGTPPIAAVVDVEPAGDGMGPPEMDATSSMRSVIDKMNGDDDMDSDDDDDDNKSMNEYDNEPHPETTGYSANVPSGNDLHREKGQYPAAQRGDNAMAATFESLMAEYKKFVSEEFDTKK